jgi:hypothetical protein
VGRDPGDLEILLLLPWVDIEMWLVPCPTADDDHGTSSVRLATFALSRAVLSLVYLFVFSDDFSFVRACLADT